MSFLSNIVHSVSNAVKNVTSAIANPVNLIKNSFINPLGSQAAAAISGASATPKQTALLTAVGAGSIYGGSLILGPNLGIAGAAVPAAGAVAATAPASVAGATVGAASTLPATTSAINSGLFDQALNSLGLGKTLSYLANPGAAESSTSGGTGAALDNTGATAPALSINWKWVIGIGLGLGVLWLLMQKR